MNHLTLNFFKEKKNQVLLLLDEYLFTLEDMKSSEKKKIEELKIEVKNDKFQIVVVGEFSRGKSTFINALLGKKLLPSSVKPTTAILNIISYSVEPCIHIYFHDKTKPTLSITEHEFSQIVAPKDPIIGDPRSESEYKKQLDFLRNISYAKIGYPIEVCKNGIEIIDTPGTNDLDPMREQITNNIIPKSDAAILLLSATKILSESELSFLKNRLLENDIHKIFIVINFKDLLKTEEDMKKVMDYATTNLKPILKEPKIFMVAAKEALNAKRKANGEVLTTRRGPIAVWDYEHTGFIEFETSLAHFLEYERGAVKLKKPIQRSIKSINEVINKQLSFERSVLKTKKEDLHTKIDSIMKQVEHLKQISQRAQKNLSFYLKKEKYEIKQWYEKALQTIYTDALQLFDDHSYLSASELGRKVEDFLGVQEREIHLQKFEQIKQAVQKSMERSSEEVNKQLGQINLEVEQLWKKEENNDTMREIDIFTYDTGFDLVKEVLDIIGHSRNYNLAVKLVLGVSAVIAGIIIGGIGALFNWLSGEDEKQRMRRDLTFQFEQKKIEKIKALEEELQYLLTEVENKYKQVLQDQISRFQSQIRQMIDSTKMEETEIQTRLEKIERWETKLNMIKNSLQSLYNELEDSQKTEEYV
ncbi:ribosome biogenesis GTPase A [Anoxybacillus tengchongensis]|uniref:Ribosome biogenesis GTPase A n=1 Tax=Anoxybacillus tengchongensis TaxID=576944 RepID=A0A7X0DBM8_9BACL|nr:dynamin family protein [Anoxybacillus tengchongensis]MBB6177319.1 ribosome biogenesis GTPase A [Anoxybacillus tengchongensis]